MFFELALALIGLLFVWDYLNKKHRNDLLNKSGIPGPTAQPILGNSWEFKDVNSDNLIENSQKYKNKYGKIYRIWILHQLSVIVLDPKYFEVILSSQQMIKKSSLYDFLVGWLGRGLLLSWGKKWHSRRKIITPTFHFKILEQFVDIFDQQSGVMVKKLYEKADGKTAIDIFPIVCLCALDIIAETAMGVKVNAQEQPGLEYVQAIAKLSHIMANRFVKPLQRTDFLFWLTENKLYKESQRCIEVLHKFTTDVIEKRREALEKSLKEGISKEDKTEDSEFNTKKRMALLDVLLQSIINGTPLTNEDIREEVDTFMFEGHDTTTSGISFALYLIARHPEVQKKLLEEIKEVIGTDKSKAVTYRDLQDLKYMECVIKESQRIYPSVPVIGRELTEDVQLGDITLPVNTNLSLNLYMVMRDPDYFTDPHDFKPERFTAESDQKINPFAYTPFSAGPRNCIGQKFAVLEMKSTLSKMLRHFELLPLGADVKPVINLILRSSTGIHIGLRPREL